MSDDAALIARQQQIRRSQALKGAMVYISALIPLMYINHLGLINLSTDGKIFGILAAVGTCAVFYLLIYYNVNLQFDEPSMTYPQVFAACAWSLLMAWNVGQEARLLPVVWLLLAFLFGVSTLKTRQYLTLSAFSLLGYLSLVVYEYLQSSGGRAYQIELMHWIILATGLMWMSLVGGYVSMLRHRLAERKRELAEMAYVDPLTRVYNRRYVMEILEREMARMRRDKSDALTVAIIDVDNFKEVNDKHGHIAGDKCLQHIARLLQDELRLTDTAGRFGGEEFIVALPDTDEAGAMVCMERFRHRVEMDDTWPNAACAPTVSVGLAQYESNTRLEMILREADTALYAAKEAGRNRVIRYSNVSKAVGKILPHPGNG